MRKGRARGIWSYVRSQVSLSTHGLFGSLRRGPGKTSVTVWHGELGKTVARAANELSYYFDRVYASNSLSKAWRSAELGVHPDSVIITGLPRNDCLRALPAGTDNSRATDHLGPHLPRGCLRASPNRGRG